jgi:dihydropteroate synthase
VSLANLVVVDTVRIGGRTSPRIMGVINVSPESFYKPSIKKSKTDIAITARRMQTDGASFIDIGGMSTAPYLRTNISIEEETRRICDAICIVKESCNLPVSVDSPRAEVVRQAIDRGASLVNDVTGLKYDKDMPALIASCGIPVIVGAFSKQQISGTLASTLESLQESLKLGKNAGIRDNKLIVDPSIGFFRKVVLNDFGTRITHLSWYKRDLQIIRNLNKLQCLAKPIAIGISSKSFLGQLFKLNFEDRLIPALLSEIKCVLNGASLIRTHHVRETALSLHACRTFGIIK